MWETEFAALQPTTMDKEPATHSTFGCNSLTWESSVKPRDRELFADVQSVLSIADSLASFRCTTTIESLNAPLFEIPVLLPEGWQILDVKGNNNASVNWRATSSPNRILVQPPNPVPSGGLITFTVEMNKAIEDPANEQNLELPVVSAEKALLIGGTYEVSTANDLTVSPTTINGLSPIGSNNGRIVFETQGTTYSGQVSVKRKAARLAARSMLTSWMDVRQKTVEGFVTVDVLNGTVRELELELPKNLGEDVRFSVASIAQVPGVNDQVVPSSLMIREQVESATSDDTRTFKLTFDKRFVGSVTLKTKVQQAREETTQLTAPFIRVTGAIRQHGLVVFEAFPEQQLSPSADFANSGLQPADASLVTAPDPSTSRRTALVYRFIQPNYSLTINELRYDTEAVPSAVCPVVSNISVLNDSGDIQRSATATIRCVGVQTLRFRLPNESEAFLWSTALDGEPVEVRKDDLDYLVSLPVDSQAKDHTLEVLFTTPQKLSSVFGQIDQDPISLAIDSDAGISTDIDILQQTWDVRFPSSSLIMNHDGDFHPQRTLDQPGWLQHAKSWFSLPSGKTLFNRLIPVLFVLAGLFVTTALLVRRRWKMLLSLVVIAAVCFSLPTSRIRKLATADSADPTSAAPQYWDDEAAEWGIESEGRALGSAVMNNAAPAPSDGAVQFDSFDVPDVALPTEESAPQRRVTGGSSGPGSSDSESASGFGGGSGGSGTARDLFGGIRLDVETDDFAESFIRAEIRQPNDSEGQTGRPMFGAGVNSDLIVENVITNNALPAQQGRQSRQAGQQSGQNGQQAQTSDPFASTQGDTTGGGGGNARPRGVVGRMIQDDLGGQQVQSYTVTPPTDLGRSSTRTGSARLSVRASIAAPDGYRSVGFRSLGGTQDAGRLSVTVQPASRVNAIRIAVVAVVALIGVSLLSAMVATKIGFLLACLIAAIALQPLVPNEWQCIVDGIAVGSGICLCIWLIFGVFRLLRCCFECCRSGRCFSWFRSKKSSAATLLLLIAATSSRSVVAAPQDERPNVIRPYSPDGIALMADQVFLPKAEFLKLYSAAYPSQIGTGDPAGSSAVVAAFYRSGDRRQIQGTQYAQAMSVRFVIQSFESKPHNVTLPIGKVAIRSAKLNETEAILLATASTQNFDSNGPAQQSANAAPIQQAEQQQARIPELNLSTTSYEVQIPGEGLHLLDVNFEVTAKVDGPIGQVQLPLQPVPVGTLTFELPADGLQARVNGRSDRHRQSDRTMLVPIANAKATRIEWSPSTKQATSDTIVHASTRSALDISDTGLLATSTVTLNCRQGQIAETTIVIPDDYAIQDIEGQGIAGWNVATADTARLTVQFQEPIEGQTTINIRMFKQAVLTTDETTIDVPVPMIAGASRDTGQVTVTAGREFEVRVAALSGVSQINAADAQLPNGLEQDLRKVLAWRYTRQPASISIRAFRTAEELKVTLLNGVQLEPQRQLWTTLISTSISGAPRRRIEVEVPAGFLALDVAANDLEDWYYSDSESNDETRILNVQFSESRIGKNEYRDSGPDRPSFRRRSSENCGPASSQCGRLFHDSQPMARRRF